MVTAASLSAEMSEKDWLTALRKIGDDEGAFCSLGPKHMAIFVEKAQDVLFVAFETQHGIRANPDSAAPLAFDICERRDWSHLSVITKGQDWFRDPELFLFFDNLVDYGYFDQFETVIFYGAGMCGYAAACYSVAAPGAQVILVAPQATLDRQFTGWDDRFPSSRRLDFSGRYADAPSLSDAAEQVLLIFDPDEREDAMHASLFRGENVSRLRYRRGSAGAIDSDLRAMASISQLAELAVNGQLTAAKAAQALRKRKRHVPYLRALLSRVLVEDRPELTAQLCRAVLASQPLPRFQHHLERAEAQLGRPISGSQNSQSS